jgi:hypothetical protein
LVAMPSGNDIAVLMSLMGASVALAGFAGLVTSIDRNAVGASATVITFRVRNLIVGAWCAVMLSLMPVMLDALNVAPGSLWQCASMIAAWTIGAIVYRAFAGGVRMRGDQGVGFSRPLFVVNIGFGVAATATAVLGAANFVPSKGALFAGLFYLLYLTGTLFYRMVHMADEAARSAARR